METPPAQPQGAVLEYKGLLSGGHQGWVTSISTPSDPTIKTIISASRDKKVLIWQLYDEEVNGKSGVSKLALKGHNQTVQDVFMSSDGLFALSGSWDKTLRLWDLVRGETVRSFTGHTSDVNSVAFSPDNRQIVSGSRDKTIKLWNTLAECKYTIVDQQHTDWISCVRFSPSSNEPTIVSGGWDKKVKVWGLGDFKLKKDLLGHQGVVYSVTVSPDGSLCASGGRDGVAMLWDVFKGKHLYSLESGYTINALCFSPCNYWLCAATDRSIKVWDLENKNVLAELVPERQHKIGLPWCVSLSWSADGRTLFAGSTNGNIYVYQVGLNYSYLTS